MIGNDTITGLTETYDNANVGTGKTLSVNTIPTLSATLTGLSSPFALAVDSSGNLYVANGADTTVSKFAPGATTPNATLTGLTSPVALAFDDSGNLYVANPGGQLVASTVSEFAAGGTTPSGTLTGLDHPYALAVDGSDNLYVANLVNNYVSVNTRVPLGPRVGRGIFIG